jgi:hypothetical protein
MSRHPQYSNSPDKNLEDMCKLLLEMEKFCIVHPNIFEQINTLMSSLYATEDEESEDSWEPSSDINDLWMAIPESDKEQFIQDLGNVIYGCMAGNIDDVNDILKLRNLDTYKDNIRVDTDIATVKKYINIKRTVWFPEDEKPARVGVYEVSSTGYDSPVFCGYASWNGENWSDSFPLLIDALAVSKIKKDHMDYNSYSWRGFANQV